MQAHMQRGRAAGSPFVPRCVCLCCLPVLPACVSACLPVQLKAVCVEAGMLALRRDGLEVNHEDFVEGIVAVQAKKKATLQYYA